MSAFGSRESVVESLSQRRELSDAAKALLADKAFGHVVRRLQQQWIEQLLSTPHAGVEQDELSCRLRALDIILAELGALLTDYREAARKARNG